MHRAKLTRLLSTCIESASVQDVDCICNHFLKNRQEIEFMEIMQDILVEHVVYQLHHENINLRSGRHKDTPARTHAHTHTRAHARTHTHTHTKGKDESCVSACLSAYLSAYLSVSLCVNVCLCISLSLCFFLPCPLQSGRG